jgi:hypothetical protein
MTREKRTVLPTTLPSLAKDHANAPRQEAIDYSSALPVDSTPGRMNKPAREGANFDEKIYLFPESFNALRTELDTWWPHLFAKVGYVMAFDAISFIEMMDYALDTKTTFDSDKVEAISKKYLNLLRNRRGVSSIS